MSRLPLPPGGEARNAAFRAEWAEREKRPLPPLHQTPLHQHDDTCLGKPILETVAANRGSMIVQVKVTIRRCRVSGQMVEVKP